jgi:hypothetical protein
MAIVIFLERVALSVFLVVRPYPTLLHGIHEMSVLAILNTKFIE